MREGDDVHRQYAHHGDAADDVQVAMRGPASVAAVIRVPRSAA